LNLGIGLYQKGWLLRGVLVVKCVECGFLALKQFAGSEIVEADSEFREDGANLHLRSTVNESFPICFMRSFDLDSECREIQASSSKRNEPDIVKEVIQKERHCDTFIPWHMGFSPKEHREILDIQMEKEWREQRLQEDRAWREEQAKQERHWRTVQLAILVAGLVITAIITIIAAFIPVWF
jgi:hypothetical protein